MAKASNLIPLLILLVFVGVAAFIGYSMYVWSSELTERGKNKLEKKNIGFTKEGGLRVGVKQMHDETYADKTQNVLVNVWNNASLPNYKSRLGWNSTQGKQPTKPSVVAHTDGNRAAASSSSSTARLAPTRPSASRTPSTPGGWD